MNQITQDETVRTPGIVVIVAILNFIGAVALLLTAAVSVLMIFFGNFLGVYEALTKKISSYTTEINLALAVNIFFGVILFGCVVMLAVSIWLGISLLKGKRAAWYVQIAVSIVGLLGFPLATVLNAVILIFFFQSTTRNFFKV